MESLLLPGYACWITLNLMEIWESKMQIQINLQWVCDIYKSFEDCLIPSFTWEMSNSSFT